MNIRELILLFLLALSLLGCSSDPGEGPVFEGDLVLSTQSEYNNFNFIHVFGKLIIDSLDNHDLSNLNSLKSVGGLIIRNSTITSLNGLQNVEIIAGDLILENNENLESLCCLNQVERLESLQLINHPSLLNIDGLSGLTSVNDTLRIRSAPQLNTLVGFQNLTTVNAPFNLNEIGIQNLDGLQNLRQIESLYFKRLESLTQATEWTQLETIQNDLEIIECSQLNLLNMSSLRNLSSIFLGVNPSLIEVDFGLVESNLDFVGIGGAPDLQLIRGLENVMELGRLDLTELVSLQDLQGFSGLTTVRGDLQLNNLSSLTSLEGLDQLVSAAMDYSGNPVNYTVFTISGLDGLQNLNGLGQLQSVGHITIKNNDNLTSLNGTNLQATIPWGCRLFVENNTNLTDFCGFSPLANSVDFNAFLVEGNAYNPTVQQLKSSSDCSL